jgi:hypothetical protein
MCDYSLENIASRPARIGDDLITTSFPITPTRGFAAVSRPNVAVCVLPGTELAFDSNVEWERFFLPFLRRREPGGKLVRFRQINVDKPRVHHDAVEFPDGKLVLLAALFEGQRATVLQLPIAPRWPHHAHARQVNQKGLEAESDGTAVPVSWPVDSWLGI